MITVYSQNILHADIYEIKARGWILEGGFSIENNLIIKFQLSTEKNTPPKFNSPIDLVQIYYDMVFKYNLPSVTDSEGDSY